MAVDTTIRAAYGRTGASQSRTCAGSTRAMRVLVKRILRKHG